MRALAKTYGIRPSKALGQHFLIDPNLARAIVADAGVGPGDRVVEVGAGVGALTVVLADAGAEVLALEFDRRLIPPLREVIGDRSGVRILAADAFGFDWARELTDGPWVMCANLPYNVAVPVVMEVLERAAPVIRLVVMVQREVGERLAAPPGGKAYGAVSVRVAYRARAELLRRVPPSVFWPKPTVDSVVVSLERHSDPPVIVDPARLWRVVDAGFAQRRKTMSSALVRLGLPRARAVEVLEVSGIDPRARAETLSLKELARIAEAFDD